MQFSTVYHFADDTDILYSCKCIKVLRKRLNKDLVLLHDWLCAKHLSLYAGKTEFIVFRPPGHKPTDGATLQLHHTKLFESSKIKYCGLILDNKLDWKPHLAELSNKPIYLIKSWYRTAPQYREFLSIISIKIFVLQHS